MSILILNHNGLRHLDECFVSLREQTHQDFRVILIDNGSTDDSVKFTRTKFPEVEIIEFSGNLGFARGYNRALNSLADEWVFILNNDTCLEPTCVEKISCAIERFPEVKIFAPKLIRYQDPGLIDSAGLGLSRYGVVFDRGASKPVTDPAFRDERFIFGGCGGAVVYASQCLQDIGYFDEDFEMYSEDADLAFRAQLLGYKCLYLPSACVRHKRGATSGNYPDWRVYIQHRNMEFVFLKNMPTKLLFRALPLHMLYIAFSVTKQAALGYAAPSIKAKIDVLFSLPALLRKRNAIQAKRKVPASHISDLVEPFELGARLKRS